MDKTVTLFNYKSSICATLRYDWWRMDVVFLFYQLVQSEKLFLDRVLIVRTLLQICQGKIEAYKNNNNPQQCAQAPALHMHPHLRSLHTCKYRPQQLFLLPCSKQDRMYRMMPFLESIGPPLMALSAKLLVRLVQACDIKLKSYKSNSQR